MKLTYIATPLLPLMDTFRNSRTYCVALDVLLSMMVATGQCNVPVRDIVGVLGQSTFLGTDNSLKCHHFRTLDITLYANIPKVLLVPSSANVPQLNCPFHVHRSNRNPFRSLLSSENCNPFVQNSFNILAIQV